jgi:hypothetical protein
MVRRSREKGTNYQTLVFARQRGKQSDTMIDIIGDTIHSIKISFTKSKKLS